jgi:hypothetical protein
VDNGGVNLALSDAPGDHLRVLGTKIKDDNLFVHAAEKRVIEDKIPPVLRDKKTCPSKIACQARGKAFVVPGVIPTPGSVCRD